MIKDFYYRVILRFKHAGIEGVLRRLVLYLARRITKFSDNKTSRYFDPFVSLIVGHQIVSPKVIRSQLKSSLPLSTDINQFLDSNTDCSIQTHDKEEIFFKPGITIQGWPSVLPTTTTTYIHPPHHIFSLHHPFIIGDEGIVLTERHELFREGYPWSERELFERTISELLLSNPVQSLTGTYIHGITRSFPNYFHWMFDLIARLAIVFEYPQFQTFPLIVPQELDENKKQMIRRLNFKGEFIPRPSNYLLVEKLLFSSFIQFTDLSSMSYTPPLWVIEKIREVFLEGRNGVHPPRSFHPRIFISRSDALSRRIVNEDEILQVLNNYGFIRINPGFYSLEEQIDFFANAEIIIGPHGAGFVNLLFCNPKVKILELFSPKFIHRAYYGLTNTRNLEYRYLVGENKGYQDIFIQPEGICEILKSWGIK